MGSGRRLAEMRAAVALVLLAACTSPAAVEPAATSTSGPTASPTPTTAQPSASSNTQVVFAPPGILPPGSRATVTAEELRIRESPGLTGNVIETARAGDVVFVGSSFPFQTNADGIDWYAVSFAAGYADWPALPATWDVGWVAAGTGADRYLELIPPRCPNGAPDLATLTSLTPWDRLACFGDRSLTVEGTWGCRGCGGVPLATSSPDGWPTRS